jgi:Holliday junction resolvase RusA-like endonuclease
VSVSVTFLHRRADRDDAPVDDRVEIIMDGKPQGKARPRFGTGGHIYTPKPTKLAEARIIDAWQMLGSPRLDGAIHLGISLVVARPKDHHKRDGTLTAKGARLPHPTGKKPDLDNA